ncbi:MAG: hypothetical protein ACRCZD_04465 [Phycicoccus sp.]
MPDLGGGSVLVRQGTPLRHPDPGPGRRSASAPVRWGALAVLAGGGPAVTSFAVTSEAAAAEPVCRTERFDDAGAGLVEWTVPPGTDEVRATLAGGRGGDAVSGGYPEPQPSEWTPSAPAGGGRGAVVTGPLDVAPGDAVVVLVGGGADGATGGVGGGGDAAPGPFAVFRGDGNEVPIRAGGGGGASDVRVGGAAAADRVLVAAGGGGAGALSWMAREVNPAIPMSPDLVGDGGDAGSAGRSSVGWVGYTPGSDPFDGTPVEGRTATNGTGLGTLAGGGAGSAGAGGAPAQPEVPPDTPAGYPLLTGAPGDEGSGGDGARGTIGSSGPLQLIATAGGGGGGGRYGGGGGGGMGVRGSSEPIPGLVSGGGGGSSLGDVTGLNDDVDGYVELTACVEVAPSPSSNPTPSVTPAPSPSTTPTTPSTSGGIGRGGDSGDGDRDSGGADAGDAPASEPLADTGSIPLGQAALVGAGAVGCGLLMHRWATRRRGEGRDRA